MDKGMRPKIRKFIKYGLLGGSVAVLLPFIAFWGFIAYASILSAFPSDEQAMVFFKRATTHTFPQNTSDIYFRMALGSPTDDGGSVITFKTDPLSIDALMSTESNWPTPDSQWRPMQSSYPCPCYDCFRYGRQVVVPRGAEFKLLGKIRAERLNQYEYTLLAVDKKRGAVYMCRLDM